MAQRSARSWPPGFAGSLEYPEVPAWAILTGSARRFGARTAFARNGAELSHAELAARAARLANGLVAAGVRPGDRVALRMPNCLEYPVAYFGVLLAGAVFVPVNPLLPEPAAAAQIADAEAVLTLAAADVPALCDGRPDTPPSARTAPGTPRNW